MLLLDELTEVLRDVDESLHHATEDELMALIRLLLGEFNNAVAMLSETMHDPSNVPQDIPDPDQDIDYVCGNCGHSKYYHTTDGCMKCLCRIPRQAVREYPRNPDIKEVD